MKVKMIAFKFIFISTEAGGGCSEYGKELTDFLAKGWEIINSTSTGNGVIYILKGLV